MILLNIWPGRNWSWLVHPRGRHVFILILIGRRFLKRWFSFSGEFGVSSRVALLKGGGEEFSGLYLLVFNLLIGGTFCSPRRYESTSLLGEGGGCYLQFVSDGSPLS